MNCNVCGSEVARTPPSMTKDGYDLIRCPTCGLLFRNSLPSEHELRSLYSIDYFRDDERSTGGYADYLRDERLHRSLAAQRLAHLERRTTGRALLDVGCAAGFFVQEAIARGWDARGVDVSAPMVEFAAERGLPVELGDLTTVPEGPFDVVTMWDYIEHSLDPAADVDRVARLLGQRGVIAISTGDIESAVARVSRGRWHLLTPRHHNYFFGRTTIRRLLQAHGFGSIEMSYPSARYSISHLTYKLDRSRRGGFFTRLAGRADRSRVGRLSLPLNLFDIVTVFAEKEA